jgi:hypothetical protein
MKRSTGSSASASSPAAQPSESASVLELEAHLVVLATGEQVELVANAPEEIQRRLVLGELLLLEQPELEEFLAAARARLRRLHRPVRDLIVAKPSRAILQVRLEQVERIAEARVPLRETSQLVVDEARGIRKDLDAQRLRELVEEHPAADQEARRQHRRLDRAVLARERHRLGDRAASQSHCCTRSATEAT